MVREYGPLIIHVFNCINNSCELAIIDPELSTAFYLDRYNMILASVGNSFKAYHTDNSDLKEYKIGITGL